MLGITLDDLILKFGFPIPNHIKIDIDGIEDRCINGGTNILRNKRVKSIIMEISDDYGKKFDSIEHKLINAGFILIKSIKTKKNMYSKKFIPGTTDYIFKKEITFD